MGGKQKRIFFSCWGEAAREKRHGIMFSNWSIEPEFVALLKHAHSNWSKASFFFGNFLLNSELKLRGKERIIMYDASFCVFFLWKNVDIHMCIFSSSCKKTQEPFYVDRTLLFFFSLWTFKHGNREKKWVEIRAPWYLLSICLSPLAVSDIVMAVATIICRNVYNDIIVPFQESFL